MIKCLVIDDEPLAQDVIARYVQQLDSLQLAATCANVFEAFNILERQPIDLVFLDIKMPVVNGIDFIRSLANPPAVIFTTAFSEYAVTSYDLEAVDYLVKPITFSRFKKSVDKFLKRSIDPEVSVKAHLYIKANGRLIKVSYREIVYAESMKDYMKIVTTQQQYITHLTMKALEELLPRDIFTRVHRSFIINRNYVRSIGKKDIELSQYSIPVGDNYRENIKSLQPGKE